MIEVKNRFKFNDIVTFKFRNKIVYGYISSYKGIYLNTKEPHYAHPKMEYKYSICTNVSKRPQIKWEHELGFVRSFDRFSDCKKYFESICKRQEIIMKKTKIYAVDVHWDLAKCYKIEASSREEAEKKITELINQGDVNVHTDGFVATDDVEVHCSGEEGVNGEIEYD